MDNLESLEKQSPLFWVVVGVALIAITGFLDLETGYEFELSFFYLIPISLMTWFTNRGIGIAASVISAFVWLITSWTAGKSYSHPFIYTWNTIIVVSFFVLVTLLLSTLKKTLEHERELACTDYLTGATNSRFFFSLMQTEISRSQRYGHPFTIAYIDVDNFKAVNDQFGHVAGDHVLRAVVSQVRKHLRKTDTIARLGGDEFAVLLPETDQESAQAALSKIQHEIFEGIDQEHGPITLSIGVLTCVGTPHTTDEIIRIVDNLMYSVKHDSKNAIKYAVYEG